jgi:hypothetical protein
MAGYSGTPLAKKLGLKAGQRVVFMNEPKGFSETLARDVPGLRNWEKGDAWDYVHLFVATRTELTMFLPRMQRRIAEDGMIWVSWPKKASKVLTDVTEDVVREVALPLGLVDIKVCAIDDTWSGLKLVIRKENRKK